MEIVHVYYFPRLDFVPLLVCNTEETADNAMNIAKTHDCVGYVKRRKVDAFSRIEIRHNVDLVFDFDPANNMEIQIGSQTPRHPHAFTKSIPLIRFLIPYNECIIHSSKPASWYEGLLNSEYRNSFKDCPAGVIKKIGQNSRMNAYCTSSFIMNGGCFYWSDSLNPPPITLRGFLVD